MEQNLLAMRPGWSILLPPEQNPLAMRPGWSGKRGFLESKILLPII
jgi:hypothetical protein